MAQLQQAGTQEDQSQTGFGLDEAEGGNEQECPATCQATRADIDVRSEHGEPMKTKILLGCPFCGNEAEIERPGNHRQSMIIACTNCGCRMESGDVIGLTPEQMWAWNRRVKTGGDTFVEPREGL